MVGSGCGGDGAMWGQSAARAPFRAPGLQTGAQAAAAFLAAAAATLLAMSSGFVDAFSRKTSGIRSSTGTARDDRSEYSPIDPRSTFPSGPRSALNESQLGALVSLGPPFHCRAVIRLIRSAVG